MANTQDGIAAIKRLVEQLDPLRGVADALTQIGSLDDAITSRKAAHAKVVTAHEAAKTALAATLAEIYYVWNRLEAVEDLLADRFDIIDDVCFLGYVRTPEEFNTMEHAIAQWCRCDRSSCAFVNSHDFRSLRRFVLYGSGTQHLAMCNESNLCVTMLDSGMMLVCAPMYLYDNSTDL